MQPLEMEERKRRREKTKHHHGKHLQGAPAQQAHQRYSKDLRQTKEVDRREPSKDLRKQLQHENGIRQLLPPKQTLSLPNHRSQAS